MIGKTHKILGAHVGAIAGTMVGATQGPVQALGGLLLWSGTGYVFASLPDRVEKPLGLPHRGVSHWPEIPLALAAIGAFMASRETDWGMWIILMFFAGVFCSVFSHWPGDVMFGKAHTIDKPGGGYTVVRPRGAPYLFGMKYIGIGLKVDSIIETRLRQVLHVLYPVTVLFMLYYVFG